ncbi:hypothetical protein GGS24DRAFT_455937 [Hypoxylon argillaceum]|nr:hypothetical protein GGS24DRAFT_455937 [Hypoxylon argillaceum]
MSFRPRLRTAELLHEEVSIALLMGSRVVIVLLLLRFMLNGVWLLGLSMLAALSWAGGGGWEEGGRGGSPYGSASQPLDWALGVPLRAAACSFGTQMRRSSELSKRHFHSGGVTL